MSTARQQPRASGATTCWVNGLAQLADSLTKLGGTARAPFWQCMRNGIGWQCKYDEKFESAKKRSKRNAGVHKSGESDVETTAELQTLLQDEGASQEVKDLLRKKYSSSLRDRTEKSSRACGFRNPSVISSVLRIPRAGVILLNNQETQPNSYRTSVHWGDRSTKKF